MELLTAFAQPADFVPVGIANVGEQEMRVAVAWVNARKGWSAPEEPLPEDQDDLWEWLWQGVDFDIEGIAQSADLPEEICGERLIALANARLIFPDGSICPAIQNLAMRARGL